MWFLLLGVLGVALKYFDIGAVGAWNWWVILSPFALALAWWAFADASGCTRRKVMEREDARKQQRIDRQRVKLGQLPGRAPRAPRDKR